MRRRKHPIVNATISAMVLYLCVIAIAGLNATPAPSDLAVVLGSDVQKNGMPQPRLKARLDCVITLYRKHFISRVLVSGGVEANGMDEAAAMAGYLMEHAIPPNAILTDSKGRNTMATAVNTAALMKENHFKSVIIVTQYFHIPRCYLAFRRAGIQGLSAAYPVFYEWRDMYSIAREGMALPYYLIRNIST